MKRYFPAPMRAIETEASYVENHAGLPLVMRIFIASSRLSIFVIVSIMLVGMAHLVGTHTVPGLILILIWGFMPILNAFQYSRVDIFFRPGFRLFSWLYTVRG